MKKLLEYLDMAEQLNADKIVIAKEDLPVIKEAVKKQIAVRPIVKDTGINRDYVCPSCGNDYLCIGSDDIKMSDCYCRDCGTKLEWSEDMR